MQASYAESWHWLTHGMRTPNEYEIFDESEDAIHRVGHLLLDAFTKHVQIDSTQDVNQLFSIAAKLEKYAAVFDKLLSSYHDLAPDILLIQETHRRLIVTSEMLALSTRGNAENKKRFSKLKMISKAEKDFICAAGYLYDAFNARAHAKHGNAMSYLSMATMLASNASADVLLAGIESTYKESLQGEQVKNTQLSQVVEWHKNISRQNGATGGRTAKISHTDVIAAAEKLIESGKPKNEINAILANRFGCTAANIRKIRNKKTQPTQG